MSFHELVGLTVLAAITLAGIGAVRRSRIWRRGAPAEVAIARGLLSIPKRYLVDVHNVVARDPATARMHVAAAGGFTLALLVLLLAVVFGGIGAPVLTWLLRLALVVMLIGAVLVARRRYPVPKPQLSRGGYDRLPFGLGAFALGFLLASVLPERPVHPAHDLFAFVSLLLVGFGLHQTVIGMTWGGVMKHALAGALHLAFHPRPGRFDASEPATALRAQRLDAPKLGVETPADFAWNRLLGFDACVQCGRCESVCPAFAAGQPLNPKKLIQDLLVGATGSGDDTAYHGSPHPSIDVGDARGAPDEPIVPSLIRAETLWSCTTCRACVHECPMLIEHVDAIVDLRRFLTMERGETPGKGAELLEELRHTDNPGGHAPGRRMDWAVDLDLPLIADLQGCDILLWMGDAAFDLRNQQTLRALVKLIRAAEVDFAVLGNEELDCGDIARRLGDDALFQDLARRNIETLGRYRFKRIVTADPHVLHCLRNEYPALGGRFEVAHHTELLAELIEVGRLRLGPIPEQRLTYHDPCYLGRYNGQVDAPRQALRALGIELREMQRSGFRSRCCGGGGGAPITDIPGKRRIPDIRMEDVKETGVSLVAVACPNCLNMLEGVVEPRPKIKDIAEILADALENRRETDGG